MAKINLLTRHSGESYGAVMQTYATCKILQSLGHRVTIINLVEKERVKKYFSIHRLRAYPKYILFWIFKFKNYPSRTRLMTTIDVRKIPAADYTVVGSDQVWNSQVTKGNKLSYFLDFSTDIPKVSLASSFGKNIWEESSDYTERVRKCLSTFKAVSVREDSGVDICNKIFGLDAICVIDPTIALGNFDNFISSKPINQIAVFLLNSNNPIFPSVAEILSKRTGLSVKVLDYYDGNQFDKLSTREKSPNRWLNEIYNSRFVITDSFHGVAFSLIFRKQFFVLCADEKKFTRIGSLLKKVGMENRVISNEDDLIYRIDTLLEPIDYTNVNLVLEREKMNYINFVKANING